MNWRPISEAKDDGEYYLVIDNACGWFKAMFRCDGWFTPGGSRIYPTHFMLVTPPGDQQQFDLTQITDENSHEAGKQAASNVDEKDYKSALLFAIGFAERIKAMIEMRNQIDLGDVLGAIRGKTPPGALQQPDADVMQKLLNCHQHMQEQAAEISELKATLVSKCREQQPDVNQRLLDAAESLLESYDVLTNESPLARNSPVMGVIKGAFVTIARDRAAIDAAKQAKQ